MTEAWTHREGRVNGIRLHGVEQGAITPAVDRVVGLDGVAVALAAMERGELRGKVVVRP